MANVRVIMTSASYHDHDPHLWASSWSSSPQHPRTRVSTLSSRTHPPEASNNTREASRDGRCRVGTVPLAGDYLNPRGSRLSAVGPRNRLVFPSPDQHLDARLNSVSSRWSVSQAICKLDSFLPEPHTTHENRTDCLLRHTQLSPRSFARSPARPKRYTLTSTSQSRLLHSLEPMSSHSKLP